MEAACPRAFDLGAETPEAQRVVPIGADLPSIVEPRAMRAARDADVAFVTIETACGGWGHRRRSLLVAGGVLQ
jgi:hypothetical protein